MKVVEFAKKHEITINQAKRTVKAVLGVDVSKDRTLSADELDKLEAALGDAQLSASQQYKALPFSDVQPIQTGVQPSESIAEQSFQENVQSLDILDVIPVQAQTNQTGVQPSEPITPESFAEQSFQEDIQPSDNLDSDFVQTAQGENAITASVPEDAIGRIEQLGSAEKDLKTGTIQLKTEISKAQGRGAGVATGLAFMQGLLEGEQEVLDVFTEESLQVFDQLQLTIDQQITEISQGTNDLLGKISKQRARNQERLQAIRSRVTKMIHKD